MPDKMWHLSPPTQAVCFSSAFRSGVCIFTCLQTVWLSGWLHHHSARPCLEESLHCLPRIDQTTALLLSPLLCCIDVCSNDFHTHCTQIFMLLNARIYTQTFENCHTINISYLSRISTQAITSVLHYCSTHLHPSWRVSYCQGQKNQPKLTSGTREGKTGREVFMEQKL